MQGTGGVYCWDEAGPHPTMALAALLALAFYLLVLKPRWRRLELLREEQIQETVEMLEYDRETPNVEKRFPRRMGRPGAPKYGALPTPRSLPPAHPALEHFERPQL